MAVACRVTLDEAGERCQEACIAVGAAAPVPFRARGAEAIVRGEMLTGEVRRAAAAQARREAQPISDVRASAAYRAALVESLVERGLQLALERACTEGRAG